MFTDEHFDCFSSQADIQGSWKVTGRYSGIPYELAHVITTGKMIKQAVIMITAPNTHQTMSVCIYIVVPQRLWLMVIFIISNVI